MPSLRWNAAITALDTGRLPCTGTEEAVLRIAASLGSLDHHNLNLVTTAITQANG